MAGARDVAGVFRRHHSRATLNHRFKGPAHSISPTGRQELHQTALQLQKEIIGC